MTTFYERLLGDPEIRNRIRQGGISDIQRLIDDMERDVPHDALPPHYDWLVSERNRKAGAQ